MIYQIVERTPYRLRFLLTAEGDILVPQCVVIPNSDTLNLQGDLRNSTRAYLGYPLANLVRTPITVGSQAAARRIFLGDTLVTVPDIEVPRAHCKLTPRKVTTNLECPWAVDANEGSNVGVVDSTGFAVLVVCGPSLEGEECYLDFYYEHTFDR